MELATCGEGRVKVEGGEFGQTYQYDDLEAAKALVAAGLKLRVLIAPKASKSERQTAEDLFDRATNWSFPKQQ